MDPNLDVKPEKMCRVCLSDSTELKSLQAKLNDEDKTILEVINFVVDIDMKLENNLPNKICKDCETILDLADMFIRRCLDSEEILGQEHPTTEKYAMVKELPVEFDKKPDVSSANANLKDALDKLIKKENDLAVYANVTISKCKGSKIDPDVIEIDDDDNIKVEFKTPLDIFENGEYLDDSVDCNETLDTEATHSETKVTKLKKPKAVKGKKGVLKKKKKKAAPKKQTETATCDKCGKIFAKKGSLRMHIARKHDIRNLGEFKCDICNKIYNHRYKLKAHLRNKHVPRVQKYDYPCKKCTRQFKFKSGLQKHLRLWHVTCFCTKCNLKFSNRYSLNDHKRECHEKDKQQLCTICGRWISFSSFADHILRHKNIRAWQCDKCEKSFISKSELQAHIRSHTGESKYICPICGGAFRTSSSMKLHLARHSDERPFSCEYCSMTFKAKGVLRNHIRTHTGEKPYKCPLCDAAFPRAHHLTMHLKRHAGDTPNIEEIKALAMKKPGRPPLLARETEIQEPAPTVFTI